MKKTIEIEDTLDDRVNDAIDEVRENFRMWMLEDIWRGPIGGEKTLVDTWYQGRDKKTYGCDIMNEAVDSNTPIYNSEIADLYYLYGSELDEAHANAGLGCDHDEKSIPSYPQCAIYCYISEKVQEYAWDVLPAFENDLDELKRSLKGINTDEAGKQVRDFITNAEL